MECTQEQSTVICGSLKVSASVSSFLEAHNDVAVSAFKDAFNKSVNLMMIKTEEIYIVCPKNIFDIITSILINKPIELSHSSEIRSWITQNSASWSTFTKSLTVEYTCAIYTETDFSKTYVFVAPQDSELVAAKFKDFLEFSQTKALPEDKNTEESSCVLVYKFFLNFLKDDEEMVAILQSGRPSSPGAPFIKIDGSKKSLKILKSKLENVTSQSCLLNASQAKLFTDFRDEILSDIFSHYLVIGNVFESDLSTDSLFLTSKTDLISIVCSQTDCCPVDNYIGLKCSFSFSQAEDMVINEGVSGVKIIKHETWNLPFNQKLEIELPLIQMDDWTVDFNSVLEKCFQILSDENSFSSKTTGIHLQVGNLKIINKFCSDLVETLQSLDQMPPYNASDKCIVVMVDTPEIQKQITEIITEIKNEGTKRIQDHFVHGAIPKDLRRLPQEIPKDKPVLWIQLSDFSGNPENLKLAADTLMNKVTKQKNNCITNKVIIHRNKLESLLFFFEKKVTECVPDIMDQFAESEDDIIPIVFPKDSLINIQQKFKRLLKKIPRRIINVQNIQDKTLLKRIILQCKQKFPHVKCDYIEAKTSIFIESLNLDDIILTERHIETKLGFLPDQENSIDELPGGLEAAFKLNRIYDITGYFTINVLHNDILSVDAEAIACPVSCSLAPIPHISDLVFKQAGPKVKEELIAHYDQYPDKMLPKGKVIFTSGGNLNSKLIICVCCSKYKHSKSDDSTKQILIQAMSDLLNIAERHELQSVAIPIIGTGIFQVPFHLCLESSLTGIEYFINHNSPKHLKVINFVDYQEDSCYLIMNFLSIYLIPFQHNLTRKREDSMEDQIEINSYRNSLGSIPDLTHNEIRKIRQRISFSILPCPVCFKQVTKPIKFNDCKHEYCSECISDYLEVIGKMCPLCLNMKPQPPGEMMVEISKTSLPGFEKFGSYIIIYKIPHGIQQVIHPNPGKIYTGTKRKAYLPANIEGTCILKMLQKAFENNLIFTVGESVSQGCSDTVIWNGILHKTSIYGGPSVYGYPDPDYLSCVLAQLIEAAITPESVESEEIKHNIRMTAFS